jgi:tripartite-type tricarboxylate transporter receptor subunit TctC
VSLLSGALARALDQPDVRAKFSGVGSEVTPLGAEAFGAFVRAENAKWQKLIRERKLQLN